MKPIFLFRKMSKNLLSALAESYSSLAEGDEQLDLGTYTQTSMESCHACDAYFCGLT